MYNNDLTVTGQTGITRGGQFNEQLEHRFIAYLDIKEKSVDTYRKGLKQFFIYLMNKGIQNPTREDFIGYREALKAEHKPSTVQTYIVVARQFFKWTAQEGIYPNIAEHVKGVTIDRDHKKDALTAKQVKTILSDFSHDTVRDKRDYAMFALMVTCGLRTIEVSRANVEDLRNEADYPVLFIQGKGRDEKNEYVKLPDPVEKAIREYLSARGKTSPTEPLFTSISNNSTGSRLTTRSISAVVKAAMQKSGYDSDRLTAHSLRHTAVTLALLNGEDITEVQQFARHANIQTTQIYNHAIDKAKNSCSSAIAGAIF